MKRKQNYFIAGIVGLASVWLVLPSPESTVVGAQKRAAKAVSVNNLSPGDVDLQKSRVYTFVEKTGFGHRHGIEGKLKSGHLNLGASKDAGKLVFDLRSFDADTPAARRYVGLEGKTSDSTRKAVNKNMFGAAVLNVPQYPTATFEISSAKQLQKTGRKGQKRYQLIGQFTLHGVTRPLQFIAEAIAGKGEAHIKGGFIIQQTSFGIKPFSKALGAVGVANELKIYGDIWISNDRNSSKRNSTKNNNHD